MKRIAILASGSGSNAKAILEFFEDKEVEIACIITNNSKAGVLKHAADHGVRTEIVSREEFYNADKPLSFLEGIDLIVLAGFLWMIPPHLLKAFPNRIVNIHPSLLPKFGGKGMYGLHVHQAVLDSPDEESGITIHFVNEQFDEGKVIFQDTCFVMCGEAPADLARRVLKLEHKHFAPQIEGVLNSL